MGDTAAKSKQMKCRVTQRASGEPTGVVTTSSVSTQKANYSRQAEPQMNPARHTASPLLSLSTETIGGHLSDRAAPATPPSSTCFNVQPTRASGETDEERHPLLFVMDEGSGKWRGANANVPPCARLLMVPSDMEGCDLALSALGCH